MTTPAHPTTRTLTYEESDPEHSAGATREGESAPVGGLQPAKRGIVSANNILSVITKRDINLAYVAYFVLALGINFSQYSQSPLTAYATSAFKSHSKLSAAGVISRVVSIVTYTVVPKLCDNIGRISPSILLFMIVCTIVSDAMMAGCKNVDTYLGANVFSGLGGTGLTMATQIYFASTSNIVSRGFYNVAADSLSAIITMYSGSEIGGRILEDLGTANGWRWGYGLWCIVNTVLAIPFIALLYSWIFRLRKADNLEPLPPYSNAVRTLFHEYDAIGIVLLAGALCLILVPVTMAKGLASKWDSANIAMLCVGCGLLLLFVLWSLPKRYRPAFLFRPTQPLIPWYTLKNRNILALCVINMFDFMSYGLFTTYFQSFMQVAVRTSPAAAAQIDNTLRIVFQVTAILVGLLMFFWTPVCKKLGLGERQFHTGYCIWVGVPLAMLSIGLDIHFVQRPHANNAVACFVIAKLLYGIARGLFQTAGQVAVQAAAKRGDLSIATGIFYMAMSVGGAIGVAVSGAVWNNVLQDALVELLPAQSRNLAKQIFDSIAVAKKYEPKSDIGIAVAASYVRTMKIMAIVATCLQIPMLFAMFFVQDVVLTEQEQEVIAGRRLALNNKEKEGSIDEKSKVDEHLKA